MSGIAITVAVVVVICVCVVAIYFVQAREKARLDRIRKIKAFGDRHDKLQRLLHELPAQYVSKELRMLIVQKSIETLTQLLNLKPSPRYEAALEADQSYLNQLQDNSLSLKPSKVSNAQQAKEVRSLLEVLYKFVHNLASRKQMPAATAKKYLDAIMFGVAQSKADVLHSNAQAAIKNGKPRVAIHAYHTAIECFNTLKNDPKAAELIAQYKEQIKVLELDADKHNQALKEKNQKASDDGDEWNKFLGQEDDQWKKKNAYDD